MVLGADIFIFREFMTQESLPLATLHGAVFEFLRDREDVVLFGAQAVNAYVGEPRMTQDIDVLSVQAAEFAEALRLDLSQRFHIAVRVRSIKAGQGYRLYQTQKSGNRHLVDVRQVKVLPPAQSMGQVLVMAPTDLIVSKVISYHQRRGKPKSGTDWRDLAMLLLTFPELKQASGPVLSGLQAAGANEAILSVWQELVAMEIETDTDDDF
ncbi:MAG: nucleotidyl transferase AbiEii/AbiGii toxin family protein [Cyanobacteria bacterium]|nr:nucleotidyl transferase AbiEii/AbiGii toxin family protein [Cyanobacteriota bacterium]MDA0867701.1 nucleotidyl transferase AbiEii/AbiGii toxin family protein [Cyanobacteriota bacterium]